MKFEFVPATKEQAYGRIALTGPSGAGKTYTALTLGTAMAETLGTKVAVIDTEKASASKYADVFSFHALNLYHYDPAIVPEALAAASANGFGVVIIDSLSHFWAGTGGILEQADQRAVRGNTFAAWKDIRPIERRMMDAITAYPGHIIVTMRVKTAYEVQTTENGKKVPVKVGLKPDQREGIEYEFDLVGDMDVSNVLRVTKSRIPDLTNRVIPQPNADMAGEILSWLRAGVPSPDAHTYRERALAPEVTVDELRAIHAEARRRGLLGAPVVTADGTPTTLGELIVSVGTRMSQTQAQDANA